MITSLTLVLLTATGPVPPKPTCLPDSAPTAVIVVDRIAEIVTRRDGEMAVKRRVLSLPFVVRSEIRLRTSGAECRRAVEAYRASLELEEHEELPDLVVVKIGQERYVVVAVDRLDSREPSWGVYDERWQEKIPFRTGVQAAREGGYFFPTPSWTRARWARIGGSRSSLWRRPVAGGPIGGPVAGGPIHDRPAAGPTSILLGGTAAPPIRLWRSSLSA